MAFKFIPSCSKLRLEVERELPEHSENVLAAVAASCSGDSEMAKTGESKNYNLT